MTAHQIDDGLCVCVCLGGLVNPVGSHHHHSKASLPLLSVESTDPLSPSFLPFSFFCHPQNVVPSIFLFRSFCFTTLVLFLSSFISPLLTSLLLAFIVIISSPVSLSFILLLSLSRSLSRFLSLPAPFPAFAFL